MLTLFSITEYSKCSSPCFTHSCLVKKLISNQYNFIFIPLTGQIVNLSSTAVFNIHNKHLVSWICWKEDTETNHIYIYIHILYIHIVSMCVRMHVHVYRKCISPNTSNIDEKTVNWIFLKSILVFILRRVK